MRRVRIVRLILVVAMLLLVARLVDVQVLHAGGFEAQARGESAITVSLPSLRGGIYARDGSPLALSVPTDDVVADDFQIVHPVQTAEALAPMLHLPVATLATQLHEHSGYVVLARQLSQATGEKIASDSIPGISLISDSKREVPNGDLASPVVGFTNAAGKGAGGLEYGDNQLLAGSDGKETILASPSGVALPQSPVTNQVATTPGTGLELTIDTQLQYESEQALAKAIESSNSVSGTAVVMDVKTGQILSMANLVATHPAPVGSPPAAANTPGGVVPIGPSDAVNEAPSNLAVTQLYEPGSVFKLVTFSAALQDALINPNTVFTVPDQLKLDGSTFHDAEPHPTEQLTAT
ncbi:MAG TPA: penicillin-binding transpeptidase domain-containing protein, partial [Acidimicrobiales bacterium]|nr:penicillin-binding transpeptidase domain-containing protein [Acidimicrobiales bacterium]